MLMTGRPAFRYSFLRRAMFSNWALRSGLRGPIVFFFNAFRLRYPCLRSNWDTTCRLTGVPNAVIRSAICRRDKFVHFTSARIGSPAVWSWSTFKKFSSRAALISINRLRPPLFFGPDRCPSRLSPSSSACPWRMVLGSHPRTPRDVLDPTMPQLRGLDGGIPSSIVLCSASQTAASSSVRFPVHRRPCCPP